MTVSATARLAVLFIVGAAVLFVAWPAPIVEARYGGSRWMFKRHYCPKDEYRRDPIGVIFYGPAAKMHSLASFFDPRNEPIVGDIEEHSGWGVEGIGEPYEHANSHNCPVQNFEQSTGGSSQYHARFWEHSKTYPEHGGHLTVGTPHYDLHREGCGRHHVPPPPVRLAFGGTGSGFDAARERLRWWYINNGRNHHHRIPPPVFWRDTYASSQCRGRFRVSSNGWVFLVRIGRR